MQLVTLLTDWGASDHYLGVVKGLLYQRIPGVTVVDIAHDIPRADIWSAGFVLSEIVRSFPEGTIHLVGVNDMASIQTPYVVVKTLGQYFVGADNGLWSFFKELLSYPPMEVHEILVYQESNVFTFPMRDLFVKVAAMLAANVSMEKIGPSTEIKGTPLMGGFLKILPQREKDSQIGLILEGKFIHFDGFGNGCTDIKKSVFEDCVKQYPFKGMVFGYGISGKSTRLPVGSYSDVSEGSIGSIFLDNGFLEIFINNGNLKEMLLIRPFQSVKVLFGQSNILSF